MAANECESPGHAMGEANHVVAKEVRKHRGSGLASSFRQVCVLLAPNPEMGAYPNPEEMGAYLKGMRGAPRRSFGGSGLQLRIRSDSSCPAQCAEGCSAAPPAASASRGRRVHHQVQRLQRVLPKHGKEEIRSAMDVARLCLAITGVLAAICAMDVARLCLGTTGVLAAICWLLIDCALALLLATGCWPTTKRPLAAVVAPR